VTLKHSVVISEFIRSGGLLLGRSGHGSRRVGGEVRLRWVELTTVKVPSHVALVMGRHCLYMNALVILVDCHHGLLLLVSALLMLRG